MIVIATTDGKYVGRETVPAVVKRGVTLVFDDVRIPVQFVFKLENGNLRVGSSNYQLEIGEV